MSLIQAFRLAGVSFTFNDPFCHSAYVNCSIHFWLSACSSRSKFQNNFVAISCNSAYARLTVFVSLWCSLHLKGCPYEGTYFLPKQLLGP